MFTQTFTPNPQVVASYEREIKDLHHMLYSETDLAMRRMINNQISELQAEASLYSSGVNL